MAMLDGSFGTPYSLDEVRLVIADHRMDAYHRDLLKWLVKEREELVANLRRCLSGYPVEGCVRELLDSLEGNNGV